MPTGRLQGDVAAVLEGRLLFGQDGLLGGEKAVMASPGLRPGVWASRRASGLSSHRPPGCLRAEPSEWRGPQMAALRLVDFNSRDESLPGHNRPPLTHSPHNAPSTDGLQGAGQAEYPPVPFTELHNFVVEVFQADAVAPLDRRQRKRAPNQRGRGSPRPSKGRRRPLRTPTPPSQPQKQGDSPSRRESSALPVKRRERGRFPGLNASLAPSLPNLAQLAVLPLARFSPCVET